MLQEGITIAKKPLRDHLEAIGHRDAFQYMLQLVDAQEELTEKVIKDIHSIVYLHDQANKGIYRRLEVMIMEPTTSRPSPTLSRYK